MKSITAKLNQLLDIIETALDTRADREGSRAEAEIEALKTLLGALADAEDEFESSWSEAGN